MIFSTRRVGATLEFIAIAEASGQIGDIGRWVLDHACATAAGWNELRPDGPPPRVAVNVSVHQLVGGDLMGDVVSAPASSGLNAANVTVELTESAIMNHSEEIVARLTALRAMGVRISTDDFGTGYSSPGRLQVLPVDEIKIDRSFVGTIEVETDQPAVVGAVLALARSLGLDVVAEGIETAAQPSSLQRAKCPAGQGFLFSPAVSAQEITARLLPTKAGVASLTAW